MTLRTILLTGASSGIGLSLAQLLQNSNYNVVAAVRPSSFDLARERGLLDCASFRLIPLDVTQHPDRVNAVRFTLETFGSLDVLINNAAVSYRSVIEDMDSFDDERQFATNFLGPQELIRLVLPSMRERRSGRIINVSSVGGMMAMPTMGAYSASKFALEGMSEALWYELRPWGISVSLIQPGFVNSESFTRVQYGARARERGLDRGPYAPCYKHMIRFIERCMRRSRATPETIALRIVQVIESKHPPLRVPVTFDAHLFGLMRRMLPRRIYHELLYRLLPGISTWGKADD